MNVQTLLHNRLRRRVLHRRDESYGRQLLAVLAVLASWVLQILHLGQKGILGLTTFIFYGHGSYQSTGGKLLTGVGRTGENTPMSFAFRHVRGYDGQILRSHIINVNHSGFWMSRPMLAEYTITWAK